MDRRARCPGESVVIVVRRRGRVRQLIGKTRDVADQGDHARVDIVCEPAPRSGSEQPETTKRRGRSTVRMALDEDAAKIEKGISGEPLEEDTIDGPERSACEE